MFPADAQQNGADMVVRVIPVPVPAVNGPFILYPIGAAAPEPRATVHEKIGRLLGVGRRKFTEYDDKRLAAIMSEHPGKGKLPGSEWRQIAHEFGGPFTTAQLQERWRNFLRPPLDRSKFTIDEKRHILKLSLGRQGRWRDIARIVGDGRSRSPMMVKNLIVPILEKLRKCSINVRSDTDIDCLPDEIFGKTLEDFPGVKRKFEENKSGLTHPL
jgi:hypothetical protein